MKHNCAIKRPKTCGDGEHQFIISKWSFDPTKQIATGYTCQRCLINVDGRDVIDKTREDIHVVASAANEAGISADTEKDNKVPRGKKS